MLFGDNRITRSGRRIGQFMMGAALVFAIVALPTGALAAATAPSLGTAQSFAVLGGSAVTNTGPTVVTGDLGVSPGSAVTGFPPGVVTGGSIHAADAVALQAQSDVTTAYNNLAGQACNSNLTGKDLGGLTLTSGVYCFSSSAPLTGTVTLDAQGSADAVFIFQIGSTLTTASSSSVHVINGGSNCNVYWQVGSSATLGTGTRFVGNILALTSVTLTTGANVAGRALARNGAVTMDTNNVSVSGCSSGAPTSTPTTTPASGTPTTTPAPRTTTATPAPGTTTGGTANSPAPCVGNIRGSKMDGAGHGLAGWTIQLLQGNQVIQSATTDASGNFSFLGLGMGAYTVQEVQHTGWVPQSPASINVTLSDCHQNLIGNTFVNVSTAGALTPTATGKATAVATATATVTPPGVGVGLKPTAVSKSQRPSTLPRTGDTLPWADPFALTLGVLLLAAGLVVRRARA